jgi:hypothetical protein
MRFRMAILIGMLLAVAGLANAAEEAPILAHSPTVSRTQIVFTHGGYLWVVPRDGGDEKPEPPAPIADRESGRLYATVDELKAMRDFAGKKGVSIDILTPPNLGSTHIDRERNPGIMLGKSPERDREIDNVCQIIRNAARVGIPAVKYNLTILGVVRSADTVGRGGARLSTFVYEQAKQDPPLTEAGPVSEDQMWERITYFLDRVAPVAAENKVRIACHPHDPGMPRDRGFPLACSCHSPQPPRLCSAPAAAPDGGARNRGQRSPARCPQSRAGSPA